MRTAKEKSQHTSRQRLELFVQRVDELYSRRLVRKGMGAQFTIQWDAASGRMTQRLTPPDEEDLRSFMLLFRQFTSHNEPIYINWIINNTIRFLKDDKLKDEVEKAKKAWNDSFSKMGAFAVVIDNQELTAEYLLDLWINGDFFHNDLELATELRRYVSTKDIMLVRMQLLTILPELTHIIGLMGTVIKHALQEGLFDIPENGT